jgi:putative phosphoesterase
MRIGIISDIHSNLIALEKVLEKLENCDMIVCAGDVVGYYPYFNEVVELLRKERIDSVMGNHDYAVVNGNFSGMNTYARISGTYTRNKLKEENMEWISNLPLKMEFEKFNLYHGTPSDTNDAFMVYIFPTFPLIGKILEVEGKNVVVGHTHVQFMKDHGDKFLLNPGSVGQPRDGDSRAAYAILDVEKDKFELGRVEYNVHEVYEGVIKAGLPVALGLRLFEGR